MEKRDYLIANKLKERLCFIVELLDFRVFSSRALETNDEYSDMDVYIQIEKLNINIHIRILIICFQCS